MIISFLINLPFFLLICLCLMPCKLVMSKPFRQCRTPQLPLRMPRLRLTSAFVALVVYPAIAAFILDAAGVVEAGWLGRSRALEMWGLTAFFALGAVLNALSRSRPERAWAPVSFVLAVCCAAIALGGD